MLVTATKDWSTHTLISSIVPVVQGERIAYRTRYGYLTEPFFVTGLLPSKLPQHNGKSSVVVACLPTEELKGWKNGDTLDTGWLLMNTIVLPSMRHWAKH